MTTVELSRRSGKSVLITRPAARLVAPAMRAAAGEDGVITLDTAGILRVGVSFFDEALLVLGELIAESGNDDLRLVYHKAPAMQSLKRLASNRGFALSETPAGDWVIGLDKDARNAKDSGDSGGVAIETSVVAETGAVAEAGITAETAVPVEASTATEAEIVAEAEIAAKTAVPLEASAQ